MRPCSPIRQCLRPECLLSKFTPRFNSSISAIRMSPFQNSRRDQRIPKKKILVKRSCQIGEVLIGLVLDSGDIQPLLKKNCWYFEWFSEPSFIRSFFLCHEVLDMSQIATAFRRISPPSFSQSRSQQHG